MSLIQSAKLNGHDPYRYLKDVLERLPTHSASRIGELSAASLSALLAVVGMAACSASAPWPASGIYKGYYTRGYELSEFVPVDTKEKWWLTGAVPCIPQYKKENVESAPNNYPARFIVVSGTLSTEGKHGHLGAYSRELTAQQVLECRELLPTDKPNF